MAPRYSMTIQLADPSVSDRSVGGHAAVIINTPDGQTYAGFGPGSYDWKSLFGAWSSPRFTPQTASPGKLPADFYSHDNFGLRRQQVSEVIFFMKFRREVANILLISKKFGG
jgi:hypothetical protein